MKWTSIKLKDISVIRTGKLDSNAAVEDGQYPFFTCDPNTLAIDNWAYDTEAILLAGNNASGNYTAKYYNGKFNAYQRTYIIESIDKQKLNTRYLSYAMNQQLSLLKNMSAGSTTKFLTIKMLHNLDVPFPAIEIQRKIANILFAYDDLIENNRKQIKLLKEVAQRLYQEWFVDLRFPGHEHTPITAGIPEGWSVTKIGELSSVLRRGISPKYNDDAQYIVINQKCIRKSVVSYEEARKQEKPYPEELNLRDGDTVICSTGAGTLGRVGQIYGNCSNTTLDSHVTLVRAAENIGVQYMYQSIKSQQEHLMTMGKGSTNQLELSRGTIHNLCVYHPTDDIMKKFEAVLQPIHDKIGTLDKMIADLICARDRLLPKLMSGEIEV